MKERKKQQNGITLVALVITIIILLILAGISISVLTNQGLFTQAQNAKNLTEEKTAEENEILKNYLEQMNAIIGGTSGGGGSQTLASKVQPGDYVTYTPDPAGTAAILTELGTYSGSTANTSSTLTQEEGLKWRVLDVVGGKVRLISATPTTKLTLSGAKGYNNAVYLLDKTCKTLYSKTGYSEKVQNLKIEDVQDYLTYDYTQYENSYVDTGKYGGTKEYTSNKNYPNLFATEKTGWVDGTKGTELDLSEQTTPLDATSTLAGTSIKITQTYWKKKMAESDFTNPIYYNLFINNGSPYSTYWMSSRCFTANSDDAGFSVRLMYSGSVSANYLYRSNDNPYSPAFALRPVVTLNSNVLVKSGEGTPESAYEI